MNRLSRCVFAQWGDNEAFGVTHIMANQWLVAGEYENETGVERASACVDAIFFRDKMKACYKDLVQTLGAKYNVPVCKHQRRRNPETLE